MAKDGRQSIVGLQANGAGTWRTAETIGANDGILPFSIDNIVLQGNSVLDESIGMDAEYMDLISEEANPTIVLPVRWDGMLWAFAANWYGDDTNTGADPYTHTMTFQPDSSLVHLTMGLEINNADILEWPSLKVIQFSLEPDGDGFWQMSVNTMGNTIQVAADATFDGTAADAVTYLTKAERMRFRANQWRRNTDAGALDSNDVEKVTNVILTCVRPYVADPETEAVTSGAEKQIPEPIQDGVADITFSYDEPTYAAIADFDDLKDSTQSKGDLIMTETISAKAYTNTIQLPLMEPIPAASALERGARIPLTRNFRCLKAQSTPTGMTNANPIHHVIINQDNLSYETGA